MNVTDTSYDALGRTVATSQPRYDTTLWSSFVPQTSSLYRATTTTYDALGRPLTVTAPNTAIVTRYAYETGTDSQGTKRWTTTIDPNRHSTRQVTDGLGWLRGVAEYLGDCNNLYGMTCGAPYTTTYSETARTRYTYDAQDRLTQVQDAAGNTTTMGYDALGAKTSMTDPDMGIWTYAYDQNGNLITQVDARSITTSFGYDVLNRLTAKTYSNGDFSRNYTYDEGAAVNGKGHRTSTCVWNGSTCAIYQRWTYDERGRTTYSAQNANGVVQELSTNYDSGDRQTSMTYGGTGAEVVTYGYDAAGRQVSLSSTVGGYVTGATYTALDQPVQRTFTSGAVQSWSYSDPMARLSSSSVTGTGSTTLMNQSYGYDPVGNITTIADSWLGQTQTFTYDHRDRLLTGVTSGSATGAYNQSYSYNTIGNLLTKAGVSYSYPAAGNARPHTPSSVGGQAYGYDADGNLSSGGGRTYIWNAENQPTSVTSGGVTETYAYDADGGRATRTRAGVTTTYALGVYEQEGAIARKYYTFAGQTIAVRDSGTGLSYLHSDHLGSASLVTTSAGAQASWQRFDPWGSVRATSSGGVTQTKRNFTGQYLDDTGLLFYNARYYDPVLGRFISADTIVPGAGALTIGGGGSSGSGPGNPEQLNRYSYVLSNPLLTADPTGHCPMCIGAAIGAAVGFGIAYGTQAYNNYQSGMDIGQAMTTNINWGTVATGTAAGAVIGGSLGVASVGTIAGYTVGSALEMGATGSAANAIGNAVGQYGASGSVNMTEVGVAAVTGFAAGVAAPVVGATAIGSMAGGYVGSVGLGSIANTAQYAATQSIEGKSITGLGLAVNAVSGGIAGAVGGPTSQLEKSLSFDTADKALSQSINAKGLLKGNITRANAVRGAISGGVSNWSYIK